ncbi:MAG: hypothetical protein Q4E64_00085 [Phascolarctobacterium sp.]|uniref:hypothetical protein n=1 Tax=Phascolarctobacterium sp. TaxID=2049039 RepID=UPI0026DDA1FC|nr:hypothetical protein [Phascolarctobacterium sp.]MDO4920220.1 hypothetical protein [Phascolarctobacterium sp.]
MNKELFKYHAAKNRDTMRDVAEILNIYPQTLSARLNGRYGKFSLDNIAILRERWHLTAEQCAEIFLD